MDEPTITAQTNAATLDEVLVRLAGHEAVQGILLLGSTGTAALMPTSDYDLLLVFAALPSPLRLVATWIEGRFAEVYCTTVPIAERATADPAAWPDASEEGALVNWLRDGRIAFDRRGQMAALQERAHQATPAPPDADEAYEAWRKIGYNAAQLRRYLADPNPDAQLAVDLRLLYSLFEVAFHYFTVRRLPWRGEKAAVRYWTEQDPAYLDLLRRCLAEPDRGRTAALYDELARRTVAPIGPLWEVGTTMVALGWGWAAGTDTEAATAGTLKDALAFWQDLVERNRAE